MRNSACGAVNVTLKSNKQLNCPAPPAMSSHRLAVIEPLPSSVLSSTPSTVTGAPIASPAVEPPCEPDQPTHVPSARRTASENGSVAANGSAVSTPPATPATARPVIVNGPADVVGAPEDVGAPDVGALGSDEPPVVPPVVDAVVPSDVAVTSTGGPALVRVGLVVGRAGCGEHGHREDEGACAAGASLQCPTAHRPRGCHGPSTRSWRRTAPAAVGGQHEPRDLLRGRPRRHHRSPGSEQRGIQRIADQHPQEHHG